MLYRKLGRETRIRRSILAGLTKDVIKNEYVVTTDARAKEVRKFVDKMITYAKNGSLVSRRKALAFLQNDKVAVDILFNDTQSLTISEVKKLFRRAHIKKLFEDGVCYFEDETNYQAFNIRNHKDLSDESLISLLTLNNVNDIIRELDILTENKRNSNVLNCVIYRICNMIRKGQLKDWDYYIRKGIESYFGTEFDRGISVLNSLDALRQ